MLHTIIPIRGYNKSEYNNYPSSRRNPLDYHVLQHLYKYRGIYIQQQTYCLYFCVTLVWLIPFDLVSHSELWTSAVASNKSFKSLFATGFKYWVC